MKYIESFNEQIQLLCSNFGEVLSEILSYCKNPEELKSDGNYYPRYFVLKTDGKYYPESWILKSDGKYHKG